MHDLFQPNWIFFFFFFFFFKFFSVLKKVFFFFFQVFAVFRNVLFLFFIFLNSFTFQYCKLMWQKWKFLMKTEQWQRSITMIHWFYVSKIYIHNNFLLLISNIICFVFVKLFYVILATGTLFKKFLLIKFKMRLLAESFCLSFMKLF